MCYQSASVYFGRISEARTVFDFGLADILQLLVKREDVWSARLFMPLTELSGIIAAGEPTHFV